VGPTKVYDAEQVVQVDPSEQTLQFGGQAFQFYLF
jgi:hypothetical protein